VETMGYSYTEGAMQSDVILISSDSDPIRDLMVSFSLVKENASSESGHISTPFYPLSVPITSRNWGSVQRISLLEESAGEYMIQVEITI
jgi:hypothetical protein